MKQLLKQVSALKANNTIGLVFVLNSEIVILKNLGLQPLAKICLLAIENIGTVWIAVL